MVMKTTEMARTKEMARLKKEKNLTVVLILNLRLDEMVELKWRTRTFEAD